MKGFSVAILLAAGVVALPAIAQDATQPAPPPAPAGPADLCKELMAFAKPSETPAAPAAEAPKPGAQAPAAGPSQPSAVNAAGGAGDKPSPVGGDVQQKSGLSGPVPTDGPSSNGRASANAAARGPAAPAAPVVAKPTPEQVAQAEAAAGAGDVAGCRASVRALRSAGVTVPAPLLALAALDPKFFVKPQ